MKKILVFGLLIMISSMIIMAQSTNGRLIGTVTGPDGLIPGATVILVDNQTGRELNAETNGEGSFTFGQLSFGTYTLKVSAAGFKTTTATDLKIDAGREYSQEIRLELGGVSESVTVVAGGDVINSTNAELSNTVSSKQVQELPLNGRNPLALLNTVAGANATSNSINGQRTSSVNYTRDGINVQDNFIRNGFVQDRPSVDDTGEFTVITQNAGAEFGGGGSAQVQLVTPRGGRDFHGAAFIYNRNAEFAANSFFGNLNGTPRPFLNRNQFGARVSGRLPFPHFGEGGPAVDYDKAFFFAAYEGFRLRQQTSAARTILLAPARNGTFTYLASNGTTQTVNVLSGTNLTGTVNPLTVDPTIQTRILDLVPTAGNGITTGINFLQTLNYNLSDNDDRERFTSRFDYDVNDRNNINFIFSWNKNDDERSDVDGGGFLANPFGSQGGPTETYNVAWSTVLGSSLTNEFRVGWNRSSPFFFGGDIADDYILAVPLISNPNPTFRDQGRDTDFWSFTDNATMTAGNHSLRFGGLFTTFKVVSTGFAGAGVPTYSISTTANPNTPGLLASQFPGGINATDLARANSLRYFLGGIIGNASITSNLVDASTGYVRGAPSIVELQFNNYAAYVSDQWRIRPDLTLNLGLRYDYFSPVKNPQQIYLEPTIPDGTDAVDAILNPAGGYQLVGGNAGSPGAFFKPDKNNFGPVVSFAYSPNFGEGGFLRSVLGGEGRTVFRGGFRMSYVNDEFVRSIDNAGLGNQGAGSVTTSQTNLNARVNTVPSFTAVPAFSPTRTFVQNNGAGFSNFGTVFAIDPNLQAQQTMEYNIGFQRELGFQTALEVRYVGGRSNSLVRSIDYNQIDIRNNGFLADFNRARSNQLINSAERTRLFNVCIAGGGTTAACNTSVNTALPASAAFNPSLVGSQTTPVFNQLVGQGLLADPTVLGSLPLGTPADLALIYLQNNLDNGIFLANDNTGVANVLTNGGLYRYNSLQVELRRRFTDGLLFQGNYTFQKILADTGSDIQNRVDPYLDNQNQRLDYARPDYDRTHSVNINAIYELPFGRGKRFLNNGGFMNAIFGGFQVTSLINLSSGPPISILDNRGVLNRAARSGRQAASSSLTGDEIKDLTGVFNTPNGIFAINPSVLFATATPLCQGQAGCTLPVIAGFDLTSPLPTGYAITSIRGANPFGSSPFPGQVFFPLNPGEVGNLQRTFINGPAYFNWDASIIKNIAFTESMRIQLRMEVFNVLNRANFFVGEGSGIFNVNSTSFGRVTSTNAPRIVQFAARFEF